MKGAFDRGRDAIRGAPLAAFKASGNISNFEAKYKKRMSALFEGDACGVCFGGDGEYVV